MIDKLKTIGRRWITNAQDEIRAGKQVLGVCHAVFPDNRVILIGTNLPKAEDRWRVVRATCDFGAVAVAIASDTYLYRAPTDFRAEGRSVEELERLSQDWERGEALVVYIETKDGDRCQLTSYYTRTPIRFSPIEETASAGWMRPLWDRVTH